jgi:hypothetical protein
MLFMRKKIFGKFKFLITSSIFSIFLASPVNAVSCPTGHYFQVYKSNGLFNYTVYYVFRVETPSWGTGEYCSKKRADRRDQPFVSMPDASEFYGGYYSWPAWQFFDFANLSDREIGIWWGNYTYDPEAITECTVGNLTNPNDMLCEENSHGGNLTIDGKRREY